MPATARRPELALRNSSDALRAATDIGAELANHGCRIVIYSFSEQFIETRAAQGYLGTGKAESKSIRLVYPQAPASLSLEIVRNFAVRLIWCRILDLFLRIPSRRRWRRTRRRRTVHDGLRACFQFSIDALLLLFAGFGGAASDVWRYLPSASVTLDERNLTAQPRW